MTYFEPTQTDVALAEIPAPDREEILAEHERTKRKIIEDTGCLDIDAHLQAWTRMLAAHTG